MPDYSCCEYKSTLEPEPRRLQELEESRGILLQVREAEEGFCMAVFSWGTVALPLELEERLRETVGKRTGILRVGSSYRIKTIDAKVIRPVKFPVKTNFW